MKDPHSIWSAIFTAMLLFTSGCLGADRDGDEPDVNTGCALTFDEPILLGDAGPGAMASEPHVAFGPDGTIVVASIWVPAHLLPVLVAGQGTGFATHMTPLPVVEPGGQNAVWTSTDGRTFTARHDALGRLEWEGHQGNQDADVAVTPDGSIHVALFGPSGIEVVTSRDGGEDWSPSGLLSPQAVDRQWIQVGPGGALLVSWNNMPGITPDLVSDGVGFAVSLDNGTTWTRNGTLDARAYGEGPMALVGDLVVAPVERDDGVVLRGIPDVSATWDNLGPSLPLDGEVSFIVPTATADGDVLVVWTQQAEDGTAHTHAATLDGGAWGAAQRISSEDGNAAFPWPVLRPDGSLAVFSYQSSETGDPTQGARTWDLRYDMLCPGSKTWHHGTVAEGIHRGAMCFDGASCPPVDGASDSDDRGLGEVFEAGVAPDGRVWVTWTATTDEQARSNQIWIAGETT